MSLQFSRFQVLPGSWYSLTSKSLSLPPTDSIVVASLKPRHFGISASARGGERERESKRERERETDRHTHTHTHRE